MKLEVGMYIRTDKGFIAKIKEFKHHYTKGKRSEDGYYVEDVLKTFVNVAVGSNYFQSPTIYEKDIKSIVTKEQFENIEVNI